MAVFKMLVIILRWHNIHKMVCATTKYAGIALATHHYSKMMSFSDCIAKRFVVSYDSEYIQ